MYTFYVKSRIIKSRQAFRYLLRACPHDAILAVFYSRVKKYISVCMLDFTSVISADLNDEIKLLLLNYCGKCVNKDHFDNIQCSQLLLIELPSVNSYLFDQNCGTMNLIGSQDHYLMTSSMSSRICRLHSSANFCRQVLQPFPLRSKYFAM